jgi:regulatory protein
MKITALEPQTRHPDRYNLSLDGRFAFALADTLVLSEGLVVGQELSAADVERLRANAEERRLYDAAVRFLAPRPRSRAEVRRRLLTPHPKRPTPTPETVERVLDRLERLELLDDRQFADFWVENRERFSPRSARVLAQELRQRGVSRETVEEVSEPEKDEERALVAGRQRLRALSGLDYETFRTRLGQFLQRRGFSYGVARTVVRQLWEESGGASKDDDEDESGTGDDFE